MFLVDSELFHRPLHHAVLRRLELARGLLQLLADRKPLRTVFLAFPAADTLRRTRRLPAHRGRLEIFPHPGLLSLRIFQIVAVERHRNVDLVRQRMPL